MFDTSPTSSAPGLVLELIPHYFEVGRRGLNVTDPGVTLELITREDRFNIEARRAKAPELAAAIGRAFGAQLIDGPRTVAASGFEFIGVGPQRWHAISRGGERVERRDTLREVTCDVATLVDVSHGFVTYRLTGPMVRDALIRLVRIDLDPASFVSGAVAATELHGMNVQIRRAIEGEAFECAVPRSFASSLYHALTSVAAPYGLWVDIAPEVA